MRFPRPLLGRRLISLVLLPVFAAGTGLVELAAPAYAAAPPVVNALDPSSGTAAGGTALQIFGSGFSGATQVAFGTATVQPCGPSFFGPCFFSGDSQISVLRIPLGNAGTTVHVTVTTPAGTSATSRADQYSYVAPAQPVVTGVTPRSGSATGGTGLQIRGSGFSGATQVAFGPTTISPCGGPTPGSGTCFSLNGDGQIFTTSPAGTAGTTVDVRVTSPAGTSAANIVDTFSYVAARAPLIDAVVPGHGTAAGGTNVQILGSDFSGATQVAFGTATLAPCGSAGPGPGSCFNMPPGNSSTIFAPSPAGAAGIVDVRVTTPAGTSAINAFDTFLYDPAVAPVVAGVSPHGGPATGGVNVQILGSGFSGATQVAFGLTTISPCGPPAPGPCFGVNGDAMISTPSPSGTPGTTVHVTVTTLLGTSPASGADTFGYVAPSAPVVDAVVPGHGTAAGGTNVQILGSGFTGATLVAFGSTTLPACGPPGSGPGACFMPSGNDTSLFVPSPSQAPGMVDVRVATAVGTSAINAFDKFTYDALGPPVVSGVTPRTGPVAGGTNVQIVGRGFTGATAVAFGATTLPACSPTPGGPCFNLPPGNDTSISASSPPETAGTVHITVTASGVTSVVSAADQFTYSSAPPPAPAPVVDAVVPNHGTAAGGTNVQILGSGLSGATAVHYGQTALPPCSPSLFGPCFFVGLNNTLSAQSPPGTAGATVDVTVTAAGVTSAVNAFDNYTYDAVGPPIVSGVSPRTGSAAGGTGVLIVGSGLTGATSVAFGSATVTPCFGQFCAGSDTNLVVTSPPGTAGMTVHVSVTTSVGTSSPGNADTFGYVAAAPPIVDAVVPGHGSAAGGTDVQIMGSGFLGVTQVAFGSATLPPCGPSVFGPCFNLGFNNGLVISAPSPSGPAGTAVDVRVTAAGGTSATNAFDKFTYDTPGAPVVLGVSPHGGSAAGGTQVQILGSDFAGATQIAFGSTVIPACGAAVQGPCFGSPPGNPGLFVPSPPGTAGQTVDIKVTTPAGSSAAATADKFTYVVPSVPMVDAVIPNQGTAVGGIDLQILGSGFAGASSVAFGTTTLPPCGPSVPGACFGPPFGGNSDNVLFASSPPGAATAQVDVTVTTATGTSATNAFDKFTFDVPGRPVVTALSPISGPSGGGSAVYISGRNFLGATAVNFGAPSSTRFFLLSPGVIQALSPAGTPCSTVDVIVTTPGGTSAASAVDQFSYGGPCTTATTLSSSANPSSFGQSVTFAATVSPVPDGGTVQFSVDGNAIGSAVLLDAVTGTASGPAMASLLPGTHTIGAAYSGDTNFTSSSGIVAQVVNCTAVPTTSLGGDLTVTAGTCASAGAVTVNGNITVQAGGALFLNGATVHGGITADGAAQLALCASSVDGALSLMNSAGFVLLGDGGEDACPANSLHGSVTVAQNRAGFEVSGNSITGSMTVNANTVITGAHAEDGGLAGNVVEGNALTGSLSCSGDAPTATAEGIANIASGGGSGECLVSNPSPPPPPHPRSLPSTGGLTPARILDTRDGTGGVAAAALGPGSALDVQIAGRGGVPASGVSAVILNVTVTGATASGYLVVYQKGITKPLASNLNWLAGQTVANLVEVPLGADGKVTVFNSQGSSNVIFDVTGFISTPDQSPGPDGLYNPLVPARLLDTRTGAGGATRVGAGGTVSLQVTGRRNVPATGVSAVVLNVTATNPTASSYLTVWPDGAPRPLASSLNFVASQTVPNRVIVAVGAGGKVDLYNFAGNVDLVVDVGGYFTDATPGGSGSRFQPLTSARLLDTRDAPGGVSSAVGTGRMLAVQVAGQKGVPAMTAGVPPTAVVLNVTVTNPTAASYLTVWPDGNAQPVASDENFGKGQTRANLVVVKVGANGKVDLFNLAGSTDVVIDVVGWYG